MYEQFYGLSNSPFDLLPDGDLVYLSKAHEEALSILRYGIIANKGFVIMTGGVGVGKTTLLNALVRMLKDEVHVCMISSPTLEREEFYYYLGHQFGFDCGGNKAKFLMAFSDYIQELLDKNQQTVLLVDEAQALSTEMFEEIRLLSNQFQTTNNFGVFFVGQPELRNEINHPRLLPLRQRVSVAHELSAMSEEDTEQYVFFRLSRANAQNTALFTDDAIKKIHKESQGNPRLINLICDSALLEGFTLDKRKIDAKIVDRSMGTLLFSGEKKLHISGSGQYKSGHSGDISRDERHGLILRIKQYIIRKLS